MQVLENGNIFVFPTLTCRFEKDDGEAMLLLDEVPVAQAPQVDIFDVLVGFDVKPTVSWYRGNSRPELMVRLAYNDAIIAKDIAKAYLLSFRHHMESLD
jgi:hypothetical protein